MKIDRAWASLAIASVSVLGCGAGAPAEAIRPDAPTASKALDEAECREVEKGGEPLIVDWKPEHRGDLEVAMKDGVAVMSYSCKGIKLLGDCKIEGDYGFIGMTKKEQVVRLANADEVKANLPFSGGSIGGEVGRGTTLDIAMMIVGKKRTTWAAATKDDLKGSCDGATHFVRGAIVGAFAMGTGSDAKVAAAAEIFGAGVSGSSTSSKQTQNRDGDIKDCANSSPDAQKPPAQCGAPIRLVLAPIAQKASTDTPPAEPPKEKKIEASEKNECPKGMVFAEGKCTKPELAKAYECDAAKVDECKTQCDKGNAASCGILAESQAQRNDFKGIGDLFKKACDGGHMRSCANYGRVLMFGFGQKQDQAAGIPFLKKACDAAEPVGCTHLGDRYWFGDAPSIPKDEAKAAKLYAQACDGGENQGCARYANAMEKGIGVSKDVQGSVKYHRRACDGGMGASCTALGNLFAKGEGVGKNEMLGKMYFQRACVRGLGDACGGMARLDLAGGKESDAKRNFQMGCNWRDSFSCAVLKLYFGEQRPYFPPNNEETQRVTGACRGGSASDCATLGVIESMRAPGMGKMNLQQACSRGDKFACEMQKKVK